MTTLRFGILGAARIAPHGFIQPAADTTSVEITRVAARDRSRAEAFASEHGIAGVSASYDELIHSEDVDVVYNPLPMSLHAEWTIAALDAGKHVLCEKPLAANADEAMAMVRAARQSGMILGEAFHYWYHPLWARVLKLVHSGTVGTVEHVEARFNIAIKQPDIRWSFETAGGSLMDLGCYPMHWVRWVVGSEPAIKSAQAVVDPSAPNIDAAITADLEFADGVTAHVQSSMIADESKGEHAIDLRIVGSEGEIHVENPLAPQNGNTLTISNNVGTTSGTIDAGVTYAHMIRAFADHVVHGTPYPTSGDDSIANMTAIDAVYRAADLPVRGT
jgi:predicted dehydrogenase